MILEKKGQGLVEYLILVCLVAVSAIAVVSVVGTNIKEQYANISAALSGKRDIKLTQPDRKTYQARGLDDFMQSARQSRGAGGR